MLRYPNGSFHKFRVRSLVGLIPLFAVDVLDEDDLAGHAGVPAQRRTGSSRNRPDLVGQALLHRNARRQDGATCSRSSIEHQLEQLLHARLGSGRSSCRRHGIRSLSKYHQEHPFSFGGSEVRYEPAEADVKIKGGNSNWRGPIWFPTSFLLIESLREARRRRSGPTFTVQDAGERRHGR